MFANCSIVFLIKEIVPMISAMSSKIVRDDKAASPRRCSYPVTSQ